MKHKKLFVYLIILISFLNFQYNLFNVVSEERFNHFQVESEQFVLDGYLNYTLNGGDLELGHFNRPSIDMFSGGQDYRPREWYVDQFIEGEFWKYKSNFGLQLKIFSFFNGNLYLVQSLASILLSIVLGIIFLFLERIHSFKFALIFLACIIFSPWITPIARNSYFFIFSYFLPFLISLYYSDKLNKSRLNLVIMLSVLYFIFLFKSLLGYDYVSVIVITSLIPITHYYLKNSFSKILLFKHISYICFVSVLSFSTALLMHYNSLEEEEDPLRWIYLTAEKRLSSSNPEKTAYDTCYELWADEDGSFNLAEKNNRDCINEISESLSKSRIEVLARSFIARHMIPFLGSNELKLTDKQDKDLKTIYYSEDIPFLSKGKEALYYWYNNNKDFKFLQLFSVFINFILSPILFLFIIVLYLYKFYRSNPNEKLFYSIILLPPVSCFVLLKGFSYVTIYTMTYFIWYIPTIPYIVSILLADRPILQKD